MFLSTKSGWKTASKFNIRNGHHWFFNKIKGIMWLSKIYQNLGIWTLKTVKSTKIVANYISKWYNSISLCRSHGFNQYPLCIKSHSPKAMKPTVHDVCSDSLVSHGSYLHLDVYCTNAWYLAPLCIVEIYSTCTTAQCPVL